MRERRRKPKQKENEERWLITYSDLITLLMIFFVIMYAMSSINQVKFSELSASLAAALHKSNQIPLQHLGSTSLLDAANPTNQGHDTSNPLQSAQNQQQAQAMNNLFKELQMYITTHHLTNNIAIVNEERGVQITLKDVVLFDTGKADIRPAAQTILAGLIPFFKSLPNQIVVEGYTDNQPISTPEYPTNWELSAGRAMRVVRFIASQGVAPDRLAGIGYGQYRPISPNTTAAGRQNNRRVNIVILRNGITPGTIAAEPQDTLLSTSTNNYSHSGSTSS